MKNIILGILFAMLWASSSVATKLGLKSVQPFILSDVRFFMAGALMIAFSFGFQKDRLPQKQEWKPLMIYGLLNVSIYLGCFVLAMQEVSAGIGSLSIATNPLIISMLSALYLGRTVKKIEIIGLVFGVLGVAIATYPLLLNSHASIKGLIILAISMFSYSVGTVYYSTVNWQLSRTSINGWQVLFGGIFILPLALFYYQPTQNQYDKGFYISVFWMVLAVSIGAVQLWLYLLKIDAVKASLWLFLCPIFGFAYARFFLNEPLTIYTFLGTALVILGLTLARQTTK